MYFSFGCKCESEHKIGEKPQVENFVVKIKILIWTKLNFSFQGNVNFYCISQFSHNKIYDLETCAVLTDKTAKNLSTLSKIPAGLSDTAIQ